MIAITVELLEKIRAIEHAANLPTKQGMLQPTVEFLVALAKSLSNNLTRVTKTQAWQIWITAFEFEASRQEKNKHHAEIAFWFGVDPYRLSNDQFVGLFANLDRVKCQQRIENGNYDATDYEHVFNLYMLAYEDENRALQARSQAIRNLMDKGRK